MKRKRRMVFLVWLLIGLGLLNTVTVRAKAEGTELITGAPRGFDGGLYRNHYL